MIPPSDDKDICNLQIKMGFNYRQDSGELIFLLSFISHPLIKLSQYSNATVKEHYNDLKQIIHYIKVTNTEGIDFWKKDQCEDLPDLPLPVIIPQTHTIDPNTQYN